MVLLLIGIALGFALLIWLWKVPIKKLVSSMEEGGSSSFEAYTIVLILVAGLSFAIYMLSAVIG